MRSSKGVAGVDRHPPKQRKRVALIIDSMMAPRRGMMTGVARFMQEHELWSIYVKPPFVTSALLRWIENWRGDGVIGNLKTVEAQGLIQAKIPFVDMGGTCEINDICIARADDRAIGRTGAEHLLECGFRNFAFCELANVFWSRLRYEGFKSLLTEYGFTAHLHTVEKPSVGPGGPDDWDRQQQEMGDWIASLPKPVGIMTTTDFLGRQVLEACQRFDAGVPDNVAVVGADNDEPICRISTPPLSSVIINDEQRGYEAAALLAEMMDGKTPAKKVILVGPSGVKARASTDVSKFEDETMVAAMQYLREHAGNNAGVDAVADAVGVSRSALDRKFRRILGRSVNDELIQLRVNNAVRLLTETQLSIRVIAQRCGFSSQAYMSTVFKAKLGRSPSAYRS